MKLFFNTWMTVFVGTLFSLNLNAATISGSLEKWAPMQLDISEPLYASDESFNSPNPFLDYRFNVEFTSPSGNVTLVPGFFDGNGEGGGSGAIWRVRFSPDEVGEWEYAISFRSGSNIAVELASDIGESIGSDGEIGSFSVIPVSATASGFLRNGRLGYDGSHYLKFSDGPHWIKGGVDSPENFFGFAGFDNTEDQPDGVNSEGLNAGLHEYQSHVADWEEGDPTFSNDMTGHDGKGIIGALNYLSSQSVNSLYFLPMNLGGDGRETYPFLIPDGTRDSNTHFDISKLNQWNMVLEHMQNKGIAAHVVLAEVEIGNSNWFDDGTLGLERKLYYRELVARFSYLLALKWNLSEESRFTAEQHREFADYLQVLDWAEHPVAVHTWKDRLERTHDDLLGDTRFTATSIQFSPVNAGKYVEHWRTQSTDAGWPWVIDMDEIGPAGTGLSDSNIDELRKSVLYPVYFSGGNIEWYFGYHALPLGGDIRTEDFRSREPMYQYMRYARELMEEEMPFYEMEPMDSLFTPSDASLVAEANPDVAMAEVFAKPGEVYAVYLPDASVDGTLRVESGEYHAQWFNPRTGEFIGEAELVSGEAITISAPPEDASEDWVFLLQLPPEEIEEPEPEVEVEPEVPVDPNENTAPVVPEQLVEPTEGMTTGGESPEPDLGAANVSGGSGVAFGLLLCLFPGLLGRKRNPSNEIFS